MLHVHIYNVKGARKAPVTTLTHGPERVNQGPQGPPGALRQTIFHKGHVAFLRRNCHSSVGIFGYICEPLHAPRTYIHCFGQV